MRMVSEGHTEEDVRKGKGSDPAGFQPTPSPQPPTDAAFGLAEMVSLRNPTHPILPPSTPDTSMLRFQAQNSALYFLLSS